MQWFKNFFSSSRHTKWYILNWIIYGIVLVGSTIYAYTRLDYVRSYSKTQTQEIQKNDRKA